MSRSSVSGPWNSAGGIETATIYALDGTSAATIANSTGVMTVASLVATTGAFLGATPVNATAATLAVTAATHGGRVVTLNRAAGITATLPAASGTGTVFRFLVGTTVTSNTTVIKVANASDVMTGSAYVISDGAAAVLGYRTAATDDTITLNGTTTGGLLGDQITVTDVGTNLFMVSVLSAATGTEATPFSATV